MAFRMGQITKASYTEMLPSKPGFEQESKFRSRRKVLQMGCCLSYGLGVWDSQGLPCRAKKNRLGGLAVTGEKWGFC